MPLIPLLTILTVFRRRVGGSHLDRQVPGNGKVYYNIRQAEESERGNLGGSLFVWGRPTEVYLGSSRGPSMHFLNLGGQRRADMVGTDPTTGHVSGCPFSSDLLGAVFRQEHETNS